MNFRQVENMKEKNIYVTRASLPSYEEYIEKIRPIWDSHWLTNMGRYHKELEQELKEYLDVPQLSLMVNGHMALELAIQMMGFPEGGEVITTPFTFISTTHAIIRNQLKPIFCDVKKNDGTIDEAKIEELITEKTVAIVPVHVYGNVCNVSEIQRIAHKYKLKVIYDAAHAFGVRYRGKGIGNYGDASIFSFHATKVFNTIEGGAVTFSAPELYEKLYDLKNFGIRGEESVVSIGANAKMNEFAAAMGLCNLEHIAEVIEKRKVGSEEYEKAIKSVEGIGLFEKNPEIDGNYGYFPILVEDEYRLSRNELYDLLRSHGIFSRKYFYPLTSDQECFKGEYKKVNLKNARELSGKVLVLPLYEELSLENINKVIEIIKGQGI
ncbi:dTDP-4-amino-4,6-dideoxy-D-glucose transaminase [Clostridiales bacterium]|jgi:dTDP-4-amino-4,6-dideoxygalactose transaminase|nr:dTDP-4-amino-4,6-dideoxy-D-glucose transaminase [Clostridiales bacterium]